MLIIKFEQLRKSNTKELKHMSEHMTELEISNLTLMIKGIEKNLSREMVFRGLCLALGVDSAFVKNHNSMRADSNNFNASIQLGSIRRVSVRNTSVNV